MSKLAHSNEETMRELEKRWLKEDLIPFVECPLCHEIFVDETGIEVVKIDCRDPDCPCGG